jgi:hypothetical protein
MLAGIILFNDHELCQYLNKMIKNLDLTSVNLNAPIDSNEMEQLCRIFSNMEEFQCGVKRSDAFPGEQKNGYDERHV